MTSKPAFEDLRILDETLPPTRYEGSGWLVAQLRDRNVRPSPLGLRVADMLGELVQGIYHIDDSVLSPSSIWDQPRYVKLCLSKGYPPLSTVDASFLTRLVFLAHDYGIRVHIEPLTFRHLQLWFHQREVRSGALPERCPTLEQAVARYREDYPAPRVEEAG